MMCVDDREQAPVEAASSPEHETSPESVANELVLAVLAEYFKQVYLEVTIHPTFAFQNFKFSEHSAAWSTLSDRDKKIAISFLLSLCHAFGISIRLKDDEFSSVEFTKEFFERWGGHGLNIISSMDVWGTFRKDLPASFNIQLPAIVSDFPDQTAGALGKKFQVQLDSSVEELCPQIPAFALTLSGTSLRVAFDVKRQIYTDEGLSVEDAASQVALAIFLILKEVELTIPEFQTALNERKEASIGLFIRLCAVSIVLALVLNGSDAKYENIEYFGALAFYAAVLGLYKWDVNQWRTYLQTVTPRPQTHPQAA